MLLAKTGVTKAGYLLKRQSPSSKNNQWRSYFFVLNDHCLSYCSEKHNFERPDGNLLLRSGTRVYQQNDEPAVIRIETGFEVLLLKGKDIAETKEWKRAIHSNVGPRLAELARGQFRVKGRGRAKDYFLMLHRECITCHPSFSETVKIVNIYQLSESSSFDVKGDSIEFKSGTKGDETLLITANNDIEHQHWCYALDIAIARLKKGASKTIIPPPNLPVHSGALHCMDTTSMKWKKKYVVLTEDSLYMHGHRTVGFDTPQQYELTPNSMIFSTTLKEHSFELVLFSESIHLKASSDAERGEWLFVLQKLIPMSSYDEGDPLQVASLEKEPEVFDTEFHSESSPGILLERRGNWAIAALVSESLSRKVCQGSVLSKIEGEPILMTGFDSVVTKLGYWKAPLRLTFQLSPRKMGWLTLMVKEKGRSWLTMKGPKHKTSHEAGIAEKVYATLSSGVMTLFTVKRDGKSKKRAFSLYGSAIGLMESNRVNGNKHCFRVLDGTEPTILQAESHDGMMEWCTSIAHSISMENGGGLLLDKEKRALAKDGFWLSGNEFPTPSISAAPPVIRGLDNEDAAKSIVFTKPIKELHLVSPESSGDVTRLEPITEKINPSKLDISHATEATETMEANTTFDPVDISQSMEDFARNFFVTTVDTSMGGTLKKKNFPVQALRTESPKPWLTIDRVSSSASSSEIFEKVSDFDVCTHLHGEDFSKLLQFTKETTSNSTPVG
ncbi:hypothetical protein ACHAXR_012395 [Thalassiosira sp. AJA248-18]